MAELLNHQHCRVCERAIPVGASTCVEHRQNYEALQRRRRRTVLLFYIGSGVLLILLIQQLLGAYL